MIPVLIGLGVGLSAIIGGTLNAAGRKVNDDYEGEIASINIKMRDLAEKTEEHSKAAQEKLKVSLDKLDECKSWIQSKALKNFSESFNKIDHLDVEKFENTNLNIIVVNGSADFNRVEINYTSEAALNAGYAADWVLSATPLAIIGFTSKLIKGVQLSYKVDEAKAELKKLECECEKIEIKIRLADDVSEKCDEVRTVLTNLRSILEKMTEKMDNDLQIYGTDFQELPEDVQRHIMSTLNLAAGINKVITTRVINEDGKIDPDFVKAVDEVKLLKN